jgi:hypothetical protein
MRRIRPKTEMLILGWLLIFVALVLAGLAVMIFPFYLKLKAGAGVVPREDLVVIVRDILGMAAALALFLAMCARAVFRNRKRLKDEPPGPA